MDIDGLFVNTMVLQSISTHTVYLTTAQVFNHTQPQLLVKQTCSGLHAVHLCSFCIGTSHRGFGVQLMHSGLQWKVAAMFVDWTWSMQKHEETHGHSWWIFKGYRPAVNSLNRVVRDLIGILNLGNAVGGDAVLKRLLNGCCPACDLSSPSISSAMWKA